MNRPADGGVLAAAGATAGATVGAVASVANSLGHRYLGGVPADATPRNRWLAVTVNCPLDEAPRGYEMFKTKADGCVRAVFRPAG